MRRSTPSPHVIAASQGDRTVLVDIGNGRYYELNPTASRIWFLLADGASETVISDRIVAEFDANSGQVASDINALLQRLVDLSLVTYEETGAASA